MRIVKAASENYVFERTAAVAVLIVGFRNSADIRDCLLALSRMSAEPGFDIFICENGGAPFFERLVRDLVHEEGPCLVVGDTGIPLDSESNRFLEIRHLRLRRRMSNVWLGCATDNLGYAGGINAWLCHLLRLPGWSGIWVLNPDTEPQAQALAALVERADTGCKGMVGSTIVDDDKPGYVRLRGGLQWQRFAARGVALGRGESLDTQPDISSVEASMDSPSGASMYVTRSCIQQIGLMDERFFLFAEDLDWGVRAKGFGLGYAPASIVAHKRGTTTGSANSLAAIPRLTVYLQHRNDIHFVRKHYPWTLPFRVTVSFLHAVRFLIRGSPNNFRATLEGLLAGLRGEIGRPDWHRRNT